MILELALSWHQIIFILISDVSKITFILSVKKSNI